MDLNNRFECRMGDVDDYHIQFNPKLWKLRPVANDTGEAMRVPAWPKAYAHDKENQGAWLAGSRPLPSQCPQYPPIRRMLLGVTSPVVAPRIGATRDAEKRMQKWSEGMEPRFISWNVAPMHTFDFSFPDAWSRKMIKVPPSRKLDVSADVWSNVYTSADDLSRLKWPGEVKVALLGVPKERRRGTGITVDGLAPHGDESVEFLVNDELFYHPGDLIVPARPDSGMDMRQGPSGPEPRPDTNEDNQMDQDDDPMEGKKDKSSGLDLGALERELLENRLSEGDHDGDFDGHILLITPSSFMSPTREAPASLSPVDPIGLAVEYSSRDTLKLLHESPRRRRIDETMRVPFLGILPEEEWEIYQCELERKAGVTWNRVTFMKGTWDEIRRDGTQSVMKVGLNQPIMREVLGKLLSSAESDVLTESVAEERADENQVVSQERAEDIEGENREQNSESESSEVEGERSSGLVAKSSSSK